MCKCCDCMFTNRPLACRASSRTGEGSSCAPLDPPASLSEYGSSRGWVTRFMHSCNSQHGPSGPPSTPPPGDEASPSLRAGCLQLWESSCGVLMPEMLRADVDTGCWRRSWISGRGACVETNEPKRVRLDTRTFTSNMGGRDRMVNAWFDCIFSNYQTKYSTYGQFATCISTSVAHIWTDLFPQRAQQARSETIIRHVGHQMSKALQDKTQRVFTNSLDQIYSLQKCKPSFSI